ncbi:hypothetical protein [Streptomyces sp. NPDC087300]|uniref:hypothetical protein n=1 Tax=Streptomyces sp. NPDC087300 TaxID=3365780 RepID=UPI00381E135E
MNNPSFDAEAVQAAPSMSKGRRPLAARPLESALFSAAMLGHRLPWTDAPARLLGLDALTPPRTPLRSLGVSWWARRARRSFDDVVAVIRVAPTGDLAGHDRPWSPDMGCPMRR